MVMYVTSRKRKISSYGSQNPKEKKVLFKKSSRFSELPGHHNEEHLYNSRLGKRKNFLHRLSPFLMMIVVLAIMIPYFYFSGTGNIHNAWLLGFLFLFLVSNILLFDFALWNYFEGRRKAVIWIIEIVFSFLLIYLLN